MESEQTTPLFDVIDEIKKLRDEAAMDIERQAKQITTEDELAYLKRLQYERDGFDALLYNKSKELAEIQESLPTKRVYLLDDVWFEKS